MLAPLLLPFFTKLLEEEEDRRDDDAGCLRQRRARFPLLGRPRPRRGHRVPPWSRR